MDVSLRLISREDSGYLFTGHGQDPPGLLAAGDILKVNAASVQALIDET
jgi:hypothetical protein